MMPVLWNSKNMTSKGLVKFSRTKRVSMTAETMKAKASIPGPNKYKYEKTYFKVLSKHFGKIPGSYM